MTSPATALPYQEPNILSILIVSSFLLIENAIGHLFDRLLYCGLIGQIAVGVAWGTPGARWLSDDVERAVVQLGYLGLILLVYQGGLLTDIPTVRSYLVLSTVVALVGISAPIALSFTLRDFMDVSWMQAFAAGAALCSTSLGTTFTILSTSGLSRSRLGVVLSSAAMIDDVFGLVMSGVIAGLGRSSAFDAVTIIRPVFVSVAFAVTVPLLCTWIGKPVAKAVARILVTEKREACYNFLFTEYAALAFHILVLSALVTGASYAGTSNLFAAYLAGASVTWWDNCCDDIRKELASSVSEKTKVVPSTISEVETATGNDRSSDGRAILTQTSATASSCKALQRNHPTPQLSSETQTSPDHQMLRDNNIDERLRGTRIFEKFFLLALEVLLKPFFFASIGFSIPVRQMFSASIIWRGMVYSVFMIIGKLLCGICLVRLQIPIVPLRLVQKRLERVLTACTPGPFRSGQIGTITIPQSEDVTVDAPGDIDTHIPTSTAPESQANPAQENVQTREPVSLYPAALLGIAMVARGEIGFLISSVAQSDGVLGTSESGQGSDLFLVVTWAILLCTLLGPIAVGLMVKRVKRLQEEERRKQTGKDDPLGIWGVLPNNDSPNPQATR